jgi:acetyl-CoA carboxylase carboxyltransferase component
MHADITGLSDLFAENDTEALYLIRKALTYFPANATEFPPKSVGEAPSRFKQNALPDIIPEDERYSYDMHHILESIVDVGSLLELKPYYDGSLITTLARIEGQVVGILANNPKINAGAMGAGACEKAVSFIILCDSFHIPLIFLHDTPGFYVSKKAEDQKMPLRIMDFINALHQCTVPRIAVIIRKSYGMAHNNMSGANMGADFVMAWPRADISFMAPEVAFNVVMGRKIKEMPNPEAVKQTFLEEMNQMNAPWEAVGLGMIDKIIDPRHTRRELIDALRFACTQTGGKSQRKMANWNKM